MNRDSERIDDQRLDELVARYSDARASGEAVDLEAFLLEVPEAHRPELARCLRMIDAGLSRAPSAAPLVPGAVLGDFEIERRIGQGGMATVYVARDRKLERRVALKVLRAALAADPRNVARFEQEAKAIARLRHPHLVEVYQVGASEGHHYLAMALVEGRTLAEVLTAWREREPRSADTLCESAGLTSRPGPQVPAEREIARWFVPAVRALAQVHELGIVHRDLKPSNLLLANDGSLCIADFSDWRARTGIRRSP